MAATSNRQAKDECSTTQSSFPSKKEKESNQYQKLLEIEKKIVREVTRRGRHHVRNSADCKAPFSEAFHPPDWFALYDLQIFSGSVYHLEEPHAQSFFFLFPIVFGDNISSRPMIA